MLLESVRNGFKNLSKRRTVNGEFEREDAPADVGVHNQL